LDDPVQPIVESAPPEDVPVQTADISGPPVAISAQDPPLVDPPVEITPTDPPVQSDNGIVPTNGFISGEKTSWATWHPYTQDNDLNLVACSNGENGLITKFGFANIQPLYPYVAAYSGATWNSPVCGQCMELMFSSRSIYITVIDQCGPPPSAPDGGTIDAHFDIAYDAFEEV
jgi:hypothetical protein